MQENKLLELISEKILQEKIKHLIWNSKTDLIIICYNKSYELQRIGFRHEEIFKKQEKCEILDIKFIEDKEIIAVFLEDKSVNFIDYSNGNLLLNHKFTKNANTNKQKPLNLNRKESKMYSNITAGNIENNMFSSNLTNFFYCEEYEIIDSKTNSLLKIDETKSFINNISIEEISKKNPYFKDLIFNSFSKIDISYLNFINNKLKLNPCIMINKSENNLELDITMGYLIKIANISKEHVTDTESNHKEVFDIKFFDKDNFLIMEKSNKNNSEDISINHKFLSLDLLSYANINVTFLSYLIFDSIQIINYINNILGIFNKTFYKLGDIFDDEYLFANNLQYSDDKDGFKNILNKQLKVLFYLGYYQDDENFKNFMQKYLYEGNSLTKLDEKIHFNLKNIEDILIENIKPCINTIIYNNNQINIIKESLDFNIENKDNLEIIMNLSHKINYICENIFNKYEDFLIQISETKKNYRNFLSWLYFFNAIFKDREKINDANINTKTILNSYPIDYNRLFYFINKSNYNLNNLINFLDKDTFPKKKEIVTNSNNISSIDNYERYLYSNCDIKINFNNYAENKIMDSSNKADFKIFKNINFSKKFINNKSNENYEKLQKLMIESKLNQKNLIVGNNIETAKNENTTTKMEIEKHNENLIYDLKTSNSTDLIESKQLIKDETIKNLLNNLRDYYNSLNKSLTDKISNQLTIQNFLTLKGLNQNLIKKIKWLDQNPNFFPYFNTKNNNLDTKEIKYMEKILIVWCFDKNLNCYSLYLFHFIFKIISKKEFSLNENININIQQKNLIIERVSYLKFPINMKNIEILDFAIHNLKNLLFLVKTYEEQINSVSSIKDGDPNNMNNNIQNDLLNNQNNLERSKSTSNIIGRTPSSNILLNNNYRYTLIKSEISNYSFENIDITDKLINENNEAIVEINLNDLNKTEMIKIDALLDVDCSDNTYISSGKRSFVSLIDLKKNKISIIDV